MAEQIKMLFGVNTLGGPWKTVLDRGPDPHREEEENLLLNYATPSYLWNS